MNYWNVLPNYVKTLSDVNGFEINLELYKTENMDKIDRWNFWEVSDDVLNRIERQITLKIKLRRQHFFK